MKTDYSSAAFLYDSVYEAIGKNYKQESGIVSSYVLRYNPHAQDLLEVACGTCGHGQFLARRFNYIGFDFSLGMLKIAKTKIPACRLFKARMQDFCLNKKFDAAVCLFSSIGHLRDFQELKQTLTNIRSHLNPGGVLVLEPWLTPDQWVDDTEGPLVSFSHQGTAWKRNVLSSREFGYSILSFAFTNLETKEVLKERLELSLFTVAETRKALSAAGFKIFHDPVGLTGRGLYIAQRPFNAQCADRVSSDAHQY